MMDSSPVCHPSLCPTVIPRYTFPTFLPQPSFHARAYESLLKPRTDLFFILFFHFASPRWRQLRWRARSPTSHDLVDLPPSDFFAWKCRPHSRIKRAAALAADFAFSGDEKVEKCRTVFDRREFWWISSGKSFLAF